MPGALWNTSSPAVADGVVVVGGRDGTIYGLKASSGRRLWQFKTGDAVLSSPSIQHGRVFVPSQDGKVYALRLADGALVWKKNLAGLEQSSPLVLGDSLIVAAGYPSRQLLRLDAATGNTLWATAPALMAQFTNSSAVSDGDQVVVGAMEGHLYSFDVATGAFRWSYQADGIVNLSAPAIVGQRVYLLPGGSSARLHAVDLATGRAAPGWPVDLPAPAADAAIVGKRLMRAQAVSSLATAANRLLFDIRFDDSFDTNDDGQVDRFAMRELVMAVDARDGHLLWQQSNGRRVIDAVNDLPKNWLCPTPVLFQGPIGGSGGGAAGWFAVAASSLVATAQTLDLANGANHGNTPLPGPTRISPVLANGRLISGSEAGIIQANLSTANQPPDAPVVQVPPAQVIGNVAPTVRWTASFDPDGDPVSYDVRLDRDGEVLESSEIEVITGPGDISARLPRDLQVGATYVVAVRARDSQGAWSDWSAPQLVRAVETPAVSVGSEPQVSLAAALAAAAMTGGTVKLAAGTFYLGETLRIPAGVTLVGAGPRQTILDATGQAIGVSLDGGVGGKPATVKSVTVAGASVGIALRGSHDAVIKNVILRDSSDAAIDVSASATGSLINATVVANGRGVRSFGAITVTNSILTGNQIALFSQHRDAVVSRYNDLIGNGVAYDGLTAGNGDIAREVAFVDYARRDLRLLPAQPTTDQGDPAEDFAAEPAPNGARINLGAFGGTAEAEVSAAPVGVVPTAAPTGGGCSVSGGDGSVAAGPTKGGGGLWDAAIKMALALSVLSLIVFRRRRAATSATVFLFACLASRSTFARTCTWNAGSGGTGGGNWSTAGAWSCGTGGNGPPASADSAVFDSTSIRPCAIDANVNVTAFSINSGYTGTVTQSSTRTMSMSGAFTQAAGTFSGGDSTIDVGGAFNLSGGAFTSTSSILTIGGAFNNTGGTFTHNSGQTLLAASSSQTFASNGAAFNNLTINDGLVGYWKLDDTASPAVDSSGWGQDATWGSSVTSSATVPPTVTFADTHSIDFSNNAATNVLTFTARKDSPLITITAWIKPAASGGGNYNRIVELAGTPFWITNTLVGAPDNKMAIGINSYRTTDGRWTSATNSISYGVWQHVAVTYDSSSTANDPIFYVNGVSSAVSQSTAPSGPQSSNATTGYIGNRIDASQGANLDRNFNGLIDEVRIYNRILSPSEIATIAAGSEPTLSAATQTLTGNPSVAGDLKILTGTLAAGSSTISVANNWTNYGVFTPGTSTVTFNGTTAGQTIFNNSFGFNNLTIGGSGVGAWQSTDSALTVAGTLAISGGAFTAPSGLLQIGGAFNETGGTFTHNSGQVMLNSITSQTFATNGATFNNLTINDGLAGYWKTDEASGTTIADSSGYGGDGTLVNGPTWVTGASLPTLSFADAAGVSFDGSNDYATLGVSNMPALDDHKTISFWAYWASKPASWQNMFAIKNGSGLLQVGFNSNSGLIKVWSGATIFAASTSTPTSGWHHIAYTWDGTTHRLYIDGGTPATSTTAPTTGATTSAWLGTYDGVNQFFAGRLDDVRVYSRALTAAEVNSLAIGRQPSTYLATQAMTGHPTIAGSLAIASGIFSVGGNSFTVKGNWWNYGGVFRASGGGNVTFNGSSSGNYIRSGGHVFQDLTVNGTGSWTLADNLEIERSHTLFMIAGTLDLSSYTYRGGQLDKTVDITPSTSTVVLDSTASRSIKTSTYNNLRIEVPETSLVGYWKFDQGEGPLAWDYAATQHHGTLTNGPLWVNSGLPSAIEFVNQGAVSLDGVDDYIDVSSAVVTTTAAFSACTWVNFTVLSGSDTFVSIDGTNTSNFFLQRQGAGKFAFSMYPTDVATFANADTALSTTTPTTGTWYHLCGVFDGTTPKLYVNGALEATGTAVTGTWAASGHTILGAAKWAGARTDYFNGKMDDVRIYNVALTAAQVASLAGGRYTGRATPATYTVVNPATVNGTFNLDSGTYSNGTLTTTITGAGYVNTGTYTVATGATGTIAVNSSFTVRNLGILDMTTSGGRIKLANGAALVMDGTLNASSSNAIIENTANGAAGSYYSFKVGSTATATPTLNITALKVLNTDTNGMYINAVTGSVTTFTRFDNITFGTGTGTQLLQIYAPSLYLVSNGCTFDTGVASGTTTYNVTLTGDGSATETRAVFGTSTCATNRTPCEGSDNDDDANTDGIGDTSATNGAVIQWVHSTSADTSGTIEGFPTAAFDWNTFTYYSTYVTYHDVAGGTADRIYVRNTNGTALYSWDTPSGVDLVGAPRYDTVSSVHYVYVATTSGKIYRLIDDGSTSLTQDTTGNWAGANNPYDCTCAITTPLTLDANNIYWGGTASSANKVWTLGKTSRALASSSPFTVTAVVSGAAPTSWTSGDTYLFMGSAAHFYKVDITTQTLTTDNSSPTGNVNGRLSIINSKLYGADSAGSLWVLDPASFGTTLWSYHDNTNHSGCASGSGCAITSSLYVDALLNRAFYGDSDGHLYASYNSSGTSGAQATGFPYRPGTSSEVYGSAPFYNSGILVAGTTTGNVYVIDVNGGSGPVLQQTYKFGAATRVSGVGYDRGSASYMVSTADATNKDGKLIYIDAIADPTPASN